MCYLSALLQSCCRDSQSRSHLTSTLPPSTKYCVWKRVSDVLVSNTTCVSLNGRLLAVGGNTLSKRPTTAIHEYNSDTDSWTIIGHMSTARSYCFAAVLPTNQLVVVGGISFPNVIDIVEIVDFTY